MRKNIIVLSVFPCLALAVCMNVTQNAAAENVVVYSEYTGPTSGYEPERYETDNLSCSFDADTGTLSIYGEGPMRSYFDVAPEWDEYYDAIFRVVLEDGITSVGSYAFVYYPNLTEVYLPDSVEVIDESAFDFNTSLRTITIPASLKYVGYRAFYNTLLWEPENLVFPEGCEYIGDFAFHSALKSGGIVSFPSTLTFLGDCSFTNAYLSDFTVADSSGTFRSENGAIYSKDGKEMRMLAPVREGLSEFLVPDGVERISSECFNQMRGIERVMIPASVTEISEDAFFSTNDLKEIIVDEANPNYKSENGLLLSRDGTLLLSWPDGTEESELVIPNGVERIAGFLFYGRKDGSYTVVLSEGVREIGTMCLPYSVTSLTLPISLEKIEPNVFYDGITVDSITYNGTLEDWNQIEIGEGNEALENIPVYTN